MHLHDTLGGITEGRITTRLLDIHGTPYSVYKTPNLITHGYREVISQLLVQNFPDAAAFEADQFRLFEVRFGTNGTTEPQRTQEDLIEFAEGAVAPITSIVRSVASSGARLVTCTALLDYGISVDGDIQELGMFTQGGIMFARQLHPRSPKHDLNALEVTWEFEVR